jgi:S1-C subfamily serine protease
MNANSSQSLRARITWLVLLVALPVVVWVAVPSGQLLIARQMTEPRPVTARPAFSSDEQATIDLFEHSKGSVVSIRTRQKMMDLWTRNVFSVPQGSGSGFVWDDDNHVVTNLHVIRDASEWWVSLSDGRDYQASLVGASPDHDLAVLHIDVTSNHPSPLPVGSSHDLKVGQRVLAIGNPFGLDWTMTTGIVSALDRSLPEENGITIEHVVQTDAAINPGNSGGPLLDSAGRLIGITTAIYSPSGAYAGVGFAVPVDIINRIVPKLIATGHYQRPDLGIISRDNLNQTITEHMKVEGVAVLQVVPGSGAFEVGLRAAQLDQRGGIVVGDVIIAIDGKAVTSPSDLNSRLDEHEIGDTVRATILRNSKQLDVNIKLQGVRNGART